MNEMDLMLAMTNIRSRYVEEARPGKGAPAKARHSLRRIAVAAIIALGLLLFFQTAPGSAAAEFIKEQVESLIQTLFPPKNMTVILEGTPVEGTYLAGGQEPEQNGSDETALPGFAIYYDPENYAMEQTDGVWRIYPVTTRESVLTYYHEELQGLSEAEREARIQRIILEAEQQEAELPKCELEIRHLPGIDPETAARGEWESALPRWDTVSEIKPNDAPEGFWFHVCAPMAWDAETADLIFTSDGQQGTYRLTLRYFMEATEGHGMRLWTMAHTFELIPQSGENPG